MKIEIGLGEVLDRLSILEIKCKRLHDDEGIAADNQYRKLRSIISINWNLDDVIISSFYHSLLRVNSTLWHYEETIRSSLNMTFKDASLGKVDWKYLVGLSIFIIEYNKERSKIKKEIDMKFNPELCEIKNYREE